MLATATSSVLHWADRASAIRCCTAFMHSEGNKLHGTLPAAICGLSNLTGLSFSGNPMHGTLPACLGQLSQLHFLLAAALSGEAAAQQAGVAALLWYCWVSQLLGAAQLHPNSPAVTVAEVAEGSSSNCTSSSSSSTSFCISTPPC